MDKKQTQKPAQQVTPKPTAPGVAKPVAKVAPKGPQLRHIVRIVNADLPGKKTIGFALKHIRGVGYVFGNMACRLAGIDPKKRTGALSDAEIAKLEEIITHPQDHNVPSWFLNRQKDYETGEDKHILGPTIKFVQDNDVRRLQKTKSYRGMRHAGGLPVRGQRTRSNFRRNKGKTVGVKKSKGKK
jgi:small subunit ribosomal protein S13